MWAAFKASSTTLELVAVFFNVDFDVGPVMDNGEGRGYFERDQLVPKRDCSSVGAGIAV